MTSGITSVDEARNALGKRLRTMAGLSGKQLAEFSVLAAVQSSKIENHTGRRHTQHRAHDLDQMSRARRQVARTSDAVVNC
jgi:RecA/RadA recombinase